MPKQISLLYKFLHSTSKEYTLNFKNEKHTHEPF